MTFCLLCDVVLLVSCLAVAWCLLPIRCYSPPSVRAIFLLCACFCLFARVAVHFLQSVCLLFACDRFAMHLLLVKAARRRPAGTLRLIPDRIAMPPRIAITHTCVFFSSVFRRAYWQGFETRPSPSDVIDFDVVFCISCLIAFGSWRSTLFLMCSKLGFV